MCAAPMDHAVTNLLTHHRPFFIEWTARAATYGGSTWVVVAALVALGLTARHLDTTRRWLAIAVGWATCVIVVTTLKYVIQRPRPPLSLAIGHGTDWAMPSAHAARAAFVATLWFLMRRSRLDAIRRARFRVVAAAYVAIVAWSRVVLGLHWLSDVVVGAAIGAVIAIDVVWLFVSRPASPVLEDGA